MEGFDGVLERVDDVVSFLKGCAIRKNRLPGVEWSSNAGEGGGLHRPLRWKSATGSMSS